MIKDVKKEVEDKKVKKVTLVENKNIFKEYDYDKLELSMEKMLKNGVHFGHTKAKCHPKMKDFIFATRNNVNILDLSISMSSLKEALSFINKIKESRKKILFVATKKQAERFVQQIAEYTENPYVIDRWLGGTLTNFKNIRKRVKYMSQLNDHFEKGELIRYTKLEQLKKKEELEKLKRRVGGIEKMISLPGAVFVTDINADRIAIKEAQALNIPVIGFADTNVNPEEVDYPIFANDDALSSLEYIFANVSKTIINKK